MNPPLIKKIPIKRDKQTPRDDKKNPIDNDKIIMTKKNNKIISPNNSDEE